MNEFSIVNRTVFCVLGFLPIQMMGVPSAPPSIPTILSASPTVPRNGTVDKPFTISGGIVFDRENNVSGKVLVSICAKDDMRRKYNTCLIPIQKSETGKGYTFEGEISVDRGGTFAVQLRLFDKELALEEITISR